MGLVDYQPEETFDSTKAASLLLGVNPSAPFSSKTSKLRPKLLVLVLFRVYPLPLAVLC